MKINAVKPARFHGRGIGIAASQKISEGETLVTVPISAMLSVDTLPESSKTRLEKVQGLTVHSLLAGFLTTDIDDPNSSYEIWRATWPTAQDLHDTMPLLWPSEAQALLPPTAKGNGSLHSSGFFLYTSPHRYHVTSALSPVLWSFSWTYTLHQRHSMRPTYSYSSVHHSNIS